MPVTNSKRPTCDVKIYLKPQDAEICDIHENIPESREVKMTVRMLLILLLANLSCALLAQEAKKTPNVELGLFPGIGVNGHLPKTEDLDRIKEAKIGWVRVDLTWNWVEPKPGQYKVGKARQACKRSRGKGDLHPRDPGIHAGMGFRGGRHPRPAEGRRGMEEVRRTIVSRYKGRINYWSLWNEPNSRTFQGKPRISSSPRSS